MKFFEIVAIAAAIDSTGMPKGTFGFVQSNTNEAGEALVRHPLIRAVGFTGSFRGGKALFDLAMARPEPIPFFGELGSINPVFVMPGALSRRADALQPRPGLAVIQGDVLDPDAVALTLHGATAVAIALGAPARDRSGIRARGTDVIAQQMREQGIERVVCLSVLGANESHRGLPLLYRALIFPLYLAPAVADHNAQELLLRESGLDFTFVRPPGFRDGPRTGAYAHGFPDESMGEFAMKISRADVADLMLRELVAPQYHRQATGISDFKRGRAAA